ncbi:hypothetical protein [Candidatus Electronema sp. PJ]|uniref:hypothetical protein n=1 Tax=Candidatus Electronema sp. PJ TaxID=3401572 RepID=UPI003AA92D3F
MIALSAFLSLLKKQAGLLVLIVVSAFVYHYFFFSRAYVEFDYTTDHDTAIQMAWGNYSRSNTSGGHLIKNDGKTGFFLDDLRKMHSLRFAPMSKAPGTVIFRRITITQPGFQPIVFDDQADFARFRQGRNISTLSFIEGWGWTVASENGSPDLYLDQLNASASGLLAEVGRFIILVLVLHLLLKAFTPLIPEFRYVSLLAVGVLLLVAVMAARTKPYSHPDELVHKAAAAYYEQHWLMPAAEAPEIAASYSGYGVSRLNSREIAYFLIGKFSKLTEPFPFASYQRYRFFNVLLLGGLVLLTFQSLAARLLLLPFLMTPQGWYLFSYCNSDAFALFITLLAAYQLIEQESFFNRLLAGRANGWLSLALLGLLAGFLLLIKKNFYIFIPFACLYLLIQRQQFSWLSLRRLMAVAGIGLALFGIRSSLDLYVNGWNKTAKLQQLKEERAETMYKPSTALAKKHPHLYLRERGVRFKEVFGDKYRWGGHIIRSFYGVYGQMSVAGSKRYYTFMQNCGWLFLGFVYLSVLLRGSWWERLLLLNLTVCSLALIGGGAWASWSKDFQPQGRYMLPVLPMLGVLIARSERLLLPLLLRSFVVLMFILSLCSFMFVGLVSPVL